MNLQDTIKLLIESYKLPRTKSIEDAINLFILGAREAGWAHNTAARYTNQFPEKTKGRAKHYIWLLEAKDLKYCHKCDTVLDSECFSNNASNVSGKNSSCNSCHLAFQRENREVYARNSANYRARKLRACPKWADLDKISEMYEKCPLGFHVDHIIPLQGVLVCGLHVESNLQYLKAVDNLKKSNKFTTI